MLDDELNRLDQLALRADYDRGVNAYMVRKSAEIALRWYRGTSILELGPAEGVATPYFLNASEDVTCVEGSRALALDIERRFPNAHVHCTLFEKYEPTRTFGTIVMGHVLEHVVNPVEILDRARSWLSPGGVIIAAVPNANSLHRQAGVKLGIIGTETDLDDGDVRVGHRRVFDMRELRNVVRMAGLAEVATGGYWLKVLPNSQIEAQWNDEQIKVYMDLGERYPEIAADIYVVAENRSA